MKIIKCVVPAILVIVLTSLNAMGAPLSWGSIETGTYNTEDSPGVLSMAQPMNQGGFSFATKQFTNDVNGADFVFDSYASKIGANSVITVDEPLQAASNPSFKDDHNSADLAAGSTYLIVNHDGTHAKIHIDRINKSCDAAWCPSTVYFSYVLEQGLTASDKCNASMADNKSIHVPIMTDGDKKYSVDMDFITAMGNNLIYRLHWIDDVNSPGVYASCMDNASSLSKADIMTIPLIVDSQNRKYKATFKVVKVSQLTTLFESDPARDPKSADLSFFMGSWRVHVPGAYYEKQIGDYIYNVIFPGDIGSTLIINKNGTFSWKGIKGRWERTGEDPVTGYPIVLRKAKDGRDWHIGFNYNLKGDTINVYVPDHESLIGGRDK